MGSTAPTGGSSEQHAEMGAGGSVDESSTVDAAQQLHLEPLDPCDLSEGASDEARQKLQLSAEEWLQLERTKDEMLEKRQRVRELLKQRFDEFCERQLSGVPGQAAAKGPSRARRLAPVC